jgi:hypothetical protein
LIMMTNYVHQVISYQDIMIDVVPVDPNDNKDKLIRNIHVHRVLDFFKNFHQQVQLFQ